MGDGRAMGEGSAGLILLSLAREQEREGGEREREEMCPICGKKHSSAHSHGSGQLLGLL